MRVSARRGGVRLLLSVLIVSAGALPARAADKIPVLIDTDLGTEAGAAFALGLALASPELEIRGITTVGQDPETRAWMVCRMLTAIGVKNVPVAAGSGKQPEEKITGQYQYRNHPAVIYNRTNKPGKQDAVELMHEKLKADHFKITILALGPLTNVARLLEQHPECTPWIRQIVVVGNPSGKGDKAQLDADAFKNVLSSSVPTVAVSIVGQRAPTMDEADCRRVFAAGTQLTYQLEALYQLSEETTPSLSSTLSVMYFTDNSLFRVQGKPLSHQTADIAGAERVRRLVLPNIERIIKFNPPAPAKPPGNVSKLIERRGLPARVHTIEDYNTDIEKRWWMAGKAETKNVPPGGQRACRGVLTLDFDDRQGDLSTNYSAVIFNPVPGPPMGKNTRLSFRYWLKGTDTIRVQLYSLSNGYHRYLSVHGLPQESWQSGTVDMTAMRRPDGSGGPLAADERIDDIQFYVDPKAEILIDDIVLHDEAASDEHEPFPKRILYTGWFDTGAFGKEWPGDFTIVPHQAPLTWKAAKSVANEKSDAPWIRLSLRGERALGKQANLRFRYHLTGAEQLRVALRSSALGKEIERPLGDLKNGAWNDAKLSFVVNEANKDAPTAIDELIFRLPKGAELLVDDVLLYEPGEVAAQ